MNITKANGKNEYELIKNLKSVRAKPMKNR